MAEAHDPTRAAAIDAYIAQLSAMPAEWASEERRFNGDPCRSSFCSDTIARAGASGSPYGLCANCDRSRRAWRRLAEDGFDPLAALRRWREGPKVASRDLGIENDLRIRLLLTPFRAAGDLARRAVHPPRNPHALSMAEALARLDVTVPSNHSRKGPRANASVEQREAWRLREAVRRARAGEPLQYTAELNDLAGLPRARHVFDDLTREVRLRHLLSAIGQHERYFDSEPILHPSGHYYTIDGVPQHGGRRELHPAARASIRRLRELGVINRSDLAALHNCSPFLVQTVANPTRLVTPRFPAVDGVKICACPDHGEGSEPFPIEDFGRGKRMADGLQVVRNECYRTYRARKDTARAARVASGELDLSTAEVWCDHCQRFHSFTEEHYMPAAIARGDRGTLCREAVSHRNYAKDALLLDLPNEVFDFAEILARWDHACAYCGAALTTKSARREHVVPVAAGGGWTARNIVPACARCNGSKLDRSVREWLDSRDDLIDYEKFERLLVERVDGEPQLVEWERLGDDGQAKARRRAARLRRKYSSMSSAELRALVKSKQAQTAQVARRPLRC